MIDTVGTFLLSKYTAELSMKKSGVILNISANLHYNGTALQSHSGSAKAGVDALTRHMAVEFGPRGIRVVGICPGPIQGTEGIDRLSPKDSNLINFVPVQRMGTKLDVANACLFSASEGASYITGSIISVEGGTNLTIPNFAFCSKDFVEGYPSFGKSKL
jgi:peroxisomal 2,4-dienoyl-CoA reductase